MKESAFSSMQNNKGVVSAGSKKNHEQRKAKVRMTLATYTLKHQV